MKKFLILLCLLISVATYGQDNISVVPKPLKHHKPTSGYGTDTLQAIIVQNKNSGGNAGFLSIVGSDTLMLQLDSNGIFHIKNANRLKVFDSILIANFDTVYKESLNERDFATSINWITTGNFSISGGTATFSGTSGTLKQRENKLALTGLGGNKYRFIYTVSNMTGVGCTAFINTDFASVNTNLVLVNATDTLNFASNSDPTDFKIECTCTSGGFDLDDFSLKVSSDSIVFVKNDLYMRGIFAEGSSAFGGDVQVLGNLKGGSPLNITTPIGEIEIDGDIHFIKNAENWTLGVDVADANQFKISNDVLLGTNDRLIIDNLGNVGIGVTPITNFHIQESNTDIVPVVEIEQLSTGDAAFQFSIAGDAYAMGIDNSDADKFKISYAAGAGTAVLGTNDRFVIDATGNIGIGTTTPDRALEISGTSNNTASVRISSFGSGFSSRVEIKRANGTEGAPTAVFAGNQLGQIAYMGHDGTSSADAALIHAVANQNWAVGSHGSRLEFQTITDGSTTFATRMTIANDGNVGIGISNPDAKLRIDQASEAIALTVVSTAFTSDGMKIVGDNLTTGSLMLASSNSSSTLSRNLVNIINDNASASGAVPLRIQQDATADIFQAFDGTTQVFSIEDGGQVGIANGSGNSAQYRLDVGFNSYFAINGNFAHIIQHNSAASTFWSIAPRNGGNLDFAVTTTDPRPSGGTIGTSDNAISIKTNKDVEFVGNVSIGIATPDANAILELASTTKGILLTRLTTTQRDAINTASLITSTLIFNTTSNRFEYWDGTIWKELTASGVPDTQTFVATGTGNTGTIQTYTVPANINSITIEAFGAQGGSADAAGGLGARMKGTFTVSPGQQLKVLVGHPGIKGDGRSSGGGGGSFVVDLGNSPLVIAGGGGGAFNAIAGLNGLTGTAGGGTNGGVGGNGGGTNDTPSGGGGGGLSTDGTDGSNGTGGLSYLNGGTGGDGGASGGDGGFGGGGSNTNSGDNVGGGGGGYSGGGSGGGPSNNIASGGGGSFNGGTSQSNTAGFQAGAGKVIIIVNP